MDSDSDMEEARVGISEEGVGSSSSGGSYSGDPRVGSDESGVGLSSPGGESDSEKSRVRTKPGFPIYNDDENYFSEEVI